MFVVKYLSSCLRVPLFSLIRVSQIQNYSGWRRCYEMTHIILRMSELSEIIAALSDIKNKLRKNSNIQRKNIKIKVFVKQRKENILKKI